MRTSGPASNGRAPMPHSARRIIAVATKRPPSRDTWKASGRVTPCKLNAPCRVGAPFGARLAARLPGDALKKGFAVLLLVLSAALALGL